MTIETFLNIARNQVGESRREELLKEETAESFEEIFARHLVNEMTKDSFQMSDNPSGGVGANSLYREFITDALAGELAARRTLGMADLITRYWDGLLTSSTGAQNILNSETHDDE